MSKAGLKMFNHSIKAMLIMLALVVSGLTMTNAVRAASQNDEIRTVIESQLNAFAADDGEKAYGFAAPNIQQIFRTPEQFMAMVKQSYQPVYRNSKRIYSEVFQDGLGRPAMRVVLTGMDGKRYEALYALEKQTDGQWKIVSCTILVIPAQGV
jgi:Domain of unknown function (DUF4864)